MKKLTILILFLFLAVSPCWGAVDFESSNSEYLSQADGLSTDISGADQSISMSAWVKIENAPGAGVDSVIGGKYHFSGNQRQYSLWINQDELLNCRILLTGDAGTSGLAVGATSLSEGTFYHVACVYDDTDIRIYLNGSLDSSANNPEAYTSGIGDQDSKFGIGAWVKSDDSNISHWDGIIEDFYVWDTALTANDIDLLYRSRLKRIGLQIKPSNLKLYCALDSCQKGTDNCSSAFNCSPGSTMSPQNTPSGSPGQILSYP